MNDLILENKPIYCVFIAPRTVTRGATKEARESGVDKENVDRHIG